MSCIQDGYCLSSVFLAALDAMGRCWCGEISTDGGAAASTPHPPLLMVPVRDGLPGERYDYEY
jgi:hypothetical protein